MGARLKILTWNVNEHYLYLLSHAGVDLFIPSDPEPGDGLKRKPILPLPANVFLIRPEDVRTVDFDCILFQSPRNYLIDQHILLSPDQHLIPKIYLEHDPPHISPASTSHVVDDPDMILVHVSHFNRLMWDNNHTPSYVIEPAVPGSDVLYTGETDRGIVVLDKIPARERDAGLDILNEVRKKIPIDVVGPGSENIGGLGNIPAPDLPEFMARYRFYFNPHRYGSIPASMLYAMSIGVPAVALPTAELPMVIDHNKSGFLSADIDTLSSIMKRLLEDPDAARNVGTAGQGVAITRFGISRFAGLWEQMFQKAASRSYPPGYFSEILKNQC